MGQSFRQLLAVVLSLGIGFLMGTGYGQHAGRLVSLDIGKGSGGGQEIGRYQLFIGPGAKQPFFFVIDTSTGKIYAYTQGYNLPYVNPGGKWDEPTEEIK